MSRAWIIVLALVGALGLTTGARAQHFSADTDPVCAGAPFSTACLGVQLSDAVAEHQEKQCQKGRPPSESQMQSARTHADHLMEAYFTLTPTSSASDINRVFNVKDATSLFRDSTGRVPAVQIKEHLGGPKPNLEPIYFVTGGDGISASGAWAVTARDGNAKPAYYLVEFRTSGSDLFRSWRIWRMALVEADTPPAAPAPFCHFNVGADW